MYPHFLGIGAQKAGTTWLYENLRRHPGVWMPPAKELHHFDCGSRYPWGLYFVYHPTIQFNLRRIAGQALRDLWITPRHTGWYLRYFMLPRSDPWYASLFSPGEGALAGEITPGYARLGEEIVARIHRLMPDLKIIYLLRNPILRTWSQAAMYFSKYGHKGLDAAPPEAIRRFLDLETTIRNADYLRTLRIWEQLYSSEQVFIGFFEELSQKPRELLERVYRFLGVSCSDPRLFDSVNERVYAREYPQIPASFARYMALQYRASIEQMHERFANEHTAGWLAYAEGALAGGEDLDAHR